jgi:HSP20 family molecular chaperone IbpA
MANQNANAAAPVRDSSSAATAATTATKDAPTSIPVNHPPRRAVDSLNEKVSRRAYELCERNGARPGDDWQHWLQAESEILSQIPEVREVSNSYAVNVPVQGFQPDEICITIDANRAIIRADKQQSTGAEGSSDSNFTQEALFLAASWPYAVDPDSATAQLKNGTLTLTVKRAQATAAATTS